MLRSTRSLARPTLVAGSGPQARVVGSLLVVLLVASAFPVFSSSALPVGAAIPATSPRPPHATAPTSSLGWAVPAWTVDVSTIGTTSSGAVPPAPPLIPSAHQPHLRLPSSPAGQSATHTASNAGPSAPSIPLSHITEGISSSQPIGSPTPPDVQLAVGPSQIVEFVNLYGEVFNLTGVSRTSYYLGTFFGTGTDYLSDPKILYDNESGRWFASMLHLNTGRTAFTNVLAVSASSNAMGTWKIYSIPDYAGSLGDQPILGVSSKLIGISVNEFNFSGGSVGNGAQFWLINKSSALAGGTLSYRSFGPYPSDGSIHPAQGVSQNATLFFVEADPTTSTRIRLIAATGVPPAAVTFVNSSLAVSSVTPAPSAAQPSTAYYIDTGDQRVQSAIWSRGNLWMALNDQCLPPGDSSYHACIRLDEINTTRRAIAQDFDLGVRGADIFYPALAENLRGDLSMVYGESSSSIYPSLYVTARTHSDPVGTLKPPVLLKAGTSSLGFGCSTSYVCRYGDFFGAGESPGNSTAWVAGEYIGSASYWETAFAMVGLPGPSIPEVWLAASPSVIDVGQSMNVTFRLLNSTCVNATGDHCSVHVVLGNSTYRASCVSPFFGAVATISFASPGRYLVGSGGYVAIYNTTTCSGAPFRNLTVIPVSVTVNALPTVRLSSSPAFPIEVGQLISIVAAATAGTPGYVYHWSNLPVGCADSQVAIETCTATGAGSGRLGVTVWDRVGGTANGSMPYTVVPDPFVNLSASTSATDAGLSVVLTASGGGGIGNLSYAWVDLPTGCFGTDRADLTCVPIAGGVFSIAVVVTDLNGFHSTSNAVSLIVYPAPAVTLRAAPSSTVIVGSSLVLSAFPTEGHAPYALSWAGLPSGCPQSLSSSVQCVPSQPGRFAVSIVVVDSLGGRATAQLNVSVAPHPPANPPAGPLSLTDAQYAGIGAVASIVVAIGVAIALRRQKKAPPGLKR